MLGGGKINTNTEISNAEERGVGIVNISLKLWDIGNL